MRAIAKERLGLTSDELRDGNALSLEFPSASIDLVCAFGVMHHIRMPSRAIAEMLRVARKAIVISDSNNFGQGSLLVRRTKQMFNLFGLWSFVDLIKTGGKGYRFSEGDGVAYSYSVFNS
jgi:ubiquinone/menaquinone biosynthesis C-methylase UbiE